MNEKLKEIIDSSSFEIKPGRYIYAKVNQFPEDGSHFMLSRDEIELTVVTREENITKLDLIEKNKDYYILIRLAVSVPFYAVGFIAAVTKAIAETGANVLAVATYSQDYIMVREEHKGVARKALLELGFKEA